MYNAYISTLLFGNKKLISPLAKLSNFCTTINRNLKYFSITQTAYISHPLISKDFLKNFCNFF